MTWARSRHIVKPIAVADREERAGGSFERRLWDEAFAELSAGHRKGELEPDDLERLAVAAYMLGRDGDSEEAWTSAHQAWWRRGETERAARCAFWQPSASSSGATWPRRWGGSPGAVGSWRRAVMTASSKAWLPMLTALPRLFEGDADVHSSFVEAARRCGPGCCRRRRCRREPLAQAPPQSSPEVRQRVRRPHPPSVPSVHGFDLRRPGASGSPFHTRGAVGSSGSARPSTRNARAAALGRSSHVVAVSGAKRRATSSEARNVRTSDTERPRSLT